MMKTRAPWAMLISGLMVTAVGCGSSGGGSSTTSSATSASSGGATSTTHASSTGATSSGSAPTHASSSSAASTASASTSSSSATSSGSTSGSGSASSSSSGSSGTSGSSLTYNTAILWPGGTAIWAVGPTSNTRVESFEMGGVTGIPAWSSDGTDIALNMHVGDDTAAYYGKTTVFQVSSGALVSAFVGTDPNWSTTLGDETLVDDVQTVTVTTEGIEIVYVQDGGLPTQGVLSAAPSSPEYSPDAQYIAFIVSGDIQISNLAGSSNNAVGATGVTSFLWYSTGPGTFGIGYVASAASGCSVYGVNVTAGVPSTPSALFSGVGCSTVASISPDGSELALADAAALYVINTNNIPTSGTAESTLTPYLTASGTIAGVGWTNDSAYLAYSTLTPNNSSPALGTITLTFLPFISGGSADIAHARTLTTVGRTFTLSP